ncbi:MAG: hypothetical protein ACOX6N_04360 [Patescibacteria group bacterium]|jgi:hypothetical protein
MVRTKLDNQLKKEALKYLGIPYWKNRITDGKITREGFLGGKGNWKQIQAETQKLLGKFPQKNTPDKVYNLQKKNRVGIDCSGLAYNLLDFLCQKIKQERLDNHITGVGGKNGIRRVSANILTSEKNAIKINNYENIKPGDLIRLDNGRHVIVILEKTGKTINYIHNSSKTYDRGVHLGSITLINPNQPLNYQQWSDILKDKGNYALLFNHKNGDGIFRLKCLS